VRERYIDRRNKKRRSGIRILPSGDTQNKRYKAYMSICFGLHGAKYSTYSNKEVTKSNSSSGFSMLFFVCFPRRARKNETIDLV
jgi:hypothetical protein